MSYMMNYYDLPSLNQYQSKEPEIGDIYRYKFISRYCSGAVLDVGCGTGFLKRYLSTNRVDQYIGLDVEGNVDIKASAYHIPFKDNRFDTVVASEVLEHLENPISVLRELLRVSDKRVIITIPNPWNANQIFSLIFRRHNLKEPNHVNLFGDNEIENLCNRCGSKLLRIERFFVPIPRTSHYLPLKSIFGEWNLYILEKIHKTV